MALKSTVVTRDESGMVVIETRNPVVKIQKVPVKRYSKYLASLGKYK